MSVEPDDGWFEVEDDKFMHEDSGREVEIEENLNQYSIRVREPEETSSGREQYRNYDRETVESRVEHIMHVWNKLWDDKTFRNAYLNTHETH